MQAGAGRGIVPVMSEATGTQEANAARAEVGRAFIVFLAFYAALAAFAVMLITLLASALTALWSTVMVNAT